MSLAGRVGQALRRYFITGLATLFPVVLTVWLIVQIVQLADGLLGNAFGFKIFGLGLLVTVVIIILVGVITVHLFGRLIFRTVEIVFVRLPFVRKVYPAVKQLAEFIFAEGGPQTRFRRVVLVPYPRVGTYSIAFVTNECKTTATGKPETLLTLLIPNPPSPFTGPIIFAPEDEVIPLDLSVEDAIKLIVSGGVVASPLKAASGSSRSA